MEPKKWRYSVSGTGGGGQGFHVTGEVAVGGTIETATEAAMHDAFSKMTKGEATYGRPGEGGCQGPYTITSFTLVRA